MCNSDQANNHPRPKSIKIKPSGAQPLNCTSLGLSFLSNLQHDFSIISTKMMPL